MSNVTLRDCTSSTATSPLIMSGDTATVTLLTAVDPHATLFTGALATFAGVNTLYALGSSAGVTVLSEATLE